MDWNFSTSKSPPYGPRFLAPVVDDTGAVALPFVIGEGELDERPQNDSSHVDAIRWVGWKFPEYSKDAREVSLPPGCGDIDGRSLDLPYILALIATVAPATEFLQLLGEDANLWATGEFKLPRHPDARNQGHIVAVDEVEFSHKAEAFLAACAADKRFRAFVVPKVNWDVFSGGRRKELQRAVAEVDIRRFDGTLGQMFPSYHLDRRPVVITLGTEPDDLEALVRLLFDTTSRRQLDARFSRVALDFVRSGVARPILAGAWLGAAVQVIVQLLPDVPSRLDWIVGAVLTQRAVVAVWSPTTWHMRQPSRPPPTLRARELRRYIRMAQVKLWYTFGGIGSVANSVTMKGGVDRALRVEAFALGALAFAELVSANWRQRLMFGVCLLGAAFWLRESLIGRLERFGGRLRFFRPYGRRVGLVLPFLFALSAALVPVEGVYVLAAAVYVHDWSFTRFADRVLWRHTLIQKLHNAAAGLAALSMVGLSTLLVFAQWAIRRHPSALPTDTAALLRSLDGVLTVGAVMWSSFVCVVTFGAQRVRADSVRAYVRLDERRSDLVSGGD